MKTRTLGIYIAVALTVALAVWKFEGAHSIIIEAPSGELAASKSVEIDEAARLAHVKENWDRHQPPIEIEEGQIEWEHLLVTRAPAQSFENEMSSPEHQFHDEADALSGEVFFDADSAMELDL